MSSHSSLSSSHKSRDDPNAKRSRRTLYVDQSPLVEHHAARHHHHKKAESTVRQIQRASKQAALASKRKIWDSNDASIDAAQQAVDHWEHGYNAVRGILVASVKAVGQGYGAAKAGATGLEHGLLSPLRDWVLLPTFSGVERIAGGTTDFLQSPQAAQVAGASLDIAKKVPFVGEHMIAPALVMSVQCMHTAWHIAQYPIPSRSAVHDSVDTIMTGTKWALSTAGREVSLYAKLVDANITRTLMHTQWKVLGSGPYATLDDGHKKEIIDHLCERYFSTVGVIERYELAAHVRAHNKPLYHDLVLTGLLRMRGGELTEDDEWLSSKPCYRSQDSKFILSKSDEIIPLWFRLPYVNGKRPGKDAPWILLPEHDKLEERYLQTLEGYHVGKSEDSSFIEKNGREEDPGVCGDSQTVDDCNPLKRYSTVAQWYEPDTMQDLLIDQKRQSVSYHPCCPRCRASHGDRRPPLLQAAFGTLCDRCETNNESILSFDMAFYPSPLSMLMRPTMWRFHGPGDEVRRAVWLMDTQRHGLQPYNEVDAAVLEDAYLFLKWKLSTQQNEDNVIDVGAVLTVQVNSPDGCEHQLVQFKDLTQVTAIPNNLGGAISLWKRRVYRGAERPAAPPTPPPFVESPSQPESSIIDESIKESYATQAETKLQEPDTTKEPGTRETVSASGITPEDSHCSVDSAGIPEFPDGKLSDLLLMSPSDHAIVEDNSLNGLDFLDEEYFETSLMDENENTIENNELETKGTLSDSNLDEADPGKKWTKPEDISSAEFLAAPVSLVKLPYNGEQICSDHDGVDHLVLIVHGIGEMLRSIDMFGIALPSLSSIVDCCQFLRENHAQIQTSPRVEYIPIEWHEAFALQSQRQPGTDLINVMQRTKGRKPNNTTMNDISLKTIPQMRTFANDTLLDVLYFMSDQHHDTIIDIVVSEMNFVVNKYRALTGFKGKISLMGHSLGSIVSWDILANQIPSLAGNVSSESSTADVQQGRSSSPGDTENPPQGRQTMVAEKGESTSEASDSSYTFSTLDNANISSTRSPKDTNQAESSSTATQPQPPLANNFPQLSFQVENAFLLGSPVAVFLMIRNQHEPLRDNFSLPGCQRIFNVFHPFDPVAYRIEPLIDNRNSEIEPRIIPYWKGGFRVQYQTKILWKKIVDTTWETQQHILDSVEARVTRLGGLLEADSTMDMLLEDDDEAAIHQQQQQQQQQSEYNDEDDDNRLWIPNCGALNGGRRIDYMLQEKEIENANEYVAAFAAHSSYWSEKDLSLFVARQIHRSKIEDDVVS